MPFSSMKLVHPKNVLFLNRIILITSVPLAFYAVTCPLGIGRLNPILAFIYLAKLVAPWFGVREYRHDQ
jgi:hypothetical protein